MKEGKLLSHPFVKGGLVWLEKHDNNNNGESDLNNFAWLASQQS
jgi:hypothetical protein